MAYDDSLYRRGGIDRSDRVGPGWREDTIFDRRDEVEPAGEDILPYPADPDDRNRTGGLPAVDPRAVGSHHNPGIPPAVLDDVFDDPAHGEPGRDRMAVHVVWEVVLLLATAALAGLLYREHPDTLVGAALDSLLVSAAALGLLALGAGLTLRTGAPNLALGPVAVASALQFAENADRGVVRAMTPAAIAVVLLGLLVALFVVGFHLPGWAVSLAAGLGIIALIQQRSTSVNVQGSWHPSRSALYLFCGFAAVALLGGLFGTIKPVRRAVGRFRPVADPAKRRGAVAAIVTATAITVSMIFAMLAGVLLAAGGTGQVAPTPGMEWSGLALGAALLAGTSAFGRRGGVFGTLLSVVLLTLFIRYAEQRGWGISRYAIAAGAMAAGVLVTRLVEAYGRPRAVRDLTEEWPGRPATTITPGWGTTRAERPEFWSSALPAQPTGRRTDPWGTDSWGGAGR